MYDKELVLDIFRQILEASQKVLSRFEPIKTVDDFTGSPEGMEKLDSICMQLVAIGESIKKIDIITHKNLLNKYPKLIGKGPKD